jgi:hypothetical protein
MLAVAVVVMVAHCRRYLAIAELPGRAAAVYALEVSNAPGALTSH